MEASLGYLLHLLGDFLPIPSLSGTILFPVGLFFMVRAMRASGQTEAVPLVALVAAAIKSASILLPFVSLRFVRNPVMAILLEGVAVWIVIGISDLKADRFLPLRAMAMSFGWRGAFLLLNRSLGLSGIASKPAAVQWNFVIMDGGIDAVIIAAAVGLTALTVRRGRESIDGWRSGFSRPLPALAAVLAGLGGQALFAAL
ncbi:MAG: hypothetical protein RQ801_13830 [Spirochaetaceae bacterium]|nr:hypothetical protein [Spirochaetaceae bacterium]